MVYQGWGLETRLPYEHVIYISSLRLDGPYEHVIILNAYIVLSDEVLPHVLDAGMCVEHILHYDLPSVKREFRQRLALLYKSVKRWVTWVLWLLM